MKVCERSCSEVLETRRSHNVLFVSALQQHLVGLSRFSLLMQYLSAFALAKKARRWRWPLAEYCEGTGQVEQKKSNEQFA